MSKCFFSETSEPLKQKLGWNDIIKNGITHLGDVVKKKLTSFKFDNSRLYTTLISKSYIRY
jgi:hypothetical protein